VAIEHKASAVHLRSSVCQFLIYSTLLLLVIFMNSPQTMMFHFHSSLLTVIAAAAAVCYVDMHWMSLQRHDVRPSWGASLMH